MSTEVNLKFLFAATAIQSLKLLMAVVVNSNFKLASVDIRATFFQSRTLDRDVFVQPPDDIKKQGVI